MIVAFNSDEWVKSQQIQINSVSATVLSTVGYFKTIIITSSAITPLGPRIYTFYTFYLASTLDKIRIDFSFQKRNKRQFNMSFDFYIISNMKNRIKEVTIEGNKDYLKTIK